MARARNNIARLSFEQRMTVAEMLANGATYDEIRDVVKSDKKLHGRSFLAYQNSEEYQQVLQAMRQSNKRFLKKRIDAFTVAEAQGVESVVKLTEAILVEQLQEFLSEEPEDSEDSGQANISDMSKAAGILSNLKKSQAEDVKRAAAEREAENQAKIAQLSATIEAQSERLRNLAGGVDGAAVADAMNKKLGITK